MTKAIAGASQSCEPALLAAEHMKPKRLPPSKRKTRPVISTKIRIRKPVSIDRMPHTFTDAHKLAHHPRNDETNCDNMDNQPTPLRWACHHRADGSNIEAWVPTQNKLTVLAQTYSTEGISASANAELIVQAVNEYHKLRPLIAELVAALEQCLVGQSLTWEAEQEGDAVCRKAPGVLGA